ncbi:hypothetical protein POTOM_030380 [Populus tomentosa]|uniref:Uncharacterized protein n=1 Tax=Populus tomentosa TaxID=118781 RepID=A0A8X7ZCQ1_POPTO|nr:hypothetical protein POTOM_030380 [Populus tomentosa]
MDYKDIAEIRIRARSFLYEEYNNRRVFLKSYPLHCGDEEQNTRQPLKRCQRQCPYGPNSAEIPPLLPPLGNCQTGTQWWKFGALF